MDENLRMMQEVLKISDPKEKAGKIIEYAEKGDKSCQALAGRGFFEGLPYFEKNEEKADYYFRRAADQGDAYSQYMIYQSKLPEMIEI